MPSSVRRVIAVVAYCGLMLTLSGAALAQYSATRLVSNLTGKALHTDPLLKNPWGIAYAPGGAFWISDEASGWSTLYDGSGNPQSLQVVIPTSSGTGTGTPTGMVYNGSTEFKIMTWTSGVPVFHAGWNYQRMVGIRAHAGVDRRAAGGGCIYRAGHH